MMSEEATEALTKSVIAMDSSRRVGWAKAFEFERQTDEVLRDLNLARGDLDSMCGFAAYLYGFVSVVEPKLAKNWVASEAVALSMLPSTPLRLGRAAGRQWMNAPPGRPKMMDDTDSGLARLVSALGGAEGLQTLLDGERRWEKRARANGAKAKKWDDLQAALKQAATQEDSHGE